MLLGALSMIYGLVLVGYGISWVIRSEEHPLDEIGLPNLVFFILVMFFEIGWAMMCLILDSKLAADAREAAHLATESERGQLAEILACLPDATWAVDAERRTVAWNRAAEELTLVPAEDVVGRLYDEGRARGPGGARRDAGRSGPRSRKARSRQVPERHT